MVWNLPRRAKDGRAAGGEFRDAAFWTCPAWRREAARPVGGACQSVGQPSWWDVAEETEQSGGISGDVSVVQERQCHAYDGASDTPYADVGEDAGISGN